MHEKETGGRLKAPHSADSQDGDRRPSGPWGSQTAPLEQGPCRPTLAAGPDPGLRITLLGEQGLCPLLGYPGPTGCLNLRLGRRGLSNPLGQDGHLCPRSMATPCPPCSLTGSPGPEQSQVGQGLVTETLFLQHFWWADFLRTFV